jgi:hypothetical protein
MESYSTYRGCGGISVWEFGSESEPRAPNEDISAETAPCAYLYFLCTLVQLFAWPKVLDYRGYRKVLDTNNWG